MLSTNCERLTRSTANITARTIPFVASALLLLWPAIWNGYPLVFSDTGTYLSQAVEHHLGWDRPVFYSFFLLPLHATITTWPAIMVQALLVVWTLHLALRCFVGPGSPLRLLVLCALLSLTTSLPWVTAQLMPDWTTGLLTIVLALLVVVPERMRWREGLVLAAFAAGLIAMHQSNVPLTTLVLAVLLPLRWWLGARRALGRSGLLRATLPLVVALLALSAVNLIGHGLASPSPYGNVFLVTRMIFDGPGERVLRRHCPQAGWKLCILTRVPMPANSDDFLWRGDSPLYRIGGPKAISNEAGAIIVDAVREEPLMVLRTAAANTIDQLAMFETGDGLQPWPNSVTPVIHRDLPAAEARTYDAALQTRGLLRVPRWMELLHTIAEPASALGTLICLVVALRRRHAVAGLCAAVLVCLIANAVITGVLSGPHGRYESRVAWLPGVAMVAAVTALRRRQHAPSLSRSLGRGPAAGAASNVWSQWDQAFPPT